MKRTYMKPTTKVVPIQQRQHLLSASPYDNQESLNVYSDDDDISDKEDIW